MGDNLAMSRYGDFLSLLLADKLGELVLCFRDGVRGHLMSSQIFWLSMARMAQGSEPGKAQAGRLGMRPKTKPSTAEEKAVTVASFGRP
jgi:hypothetical protein